MINIKKVVLFGPESTGKTSLASSLASYYHTLWCPEFVRDYLSMKNQIEHRISRGIVSVYEDIEPMAIGQMSMENTLVSQANCFLFYDTNLLTNLIYSNYYFHKAPDWLSTLLENRRYDLYLLLGTDVAWEYDPLRDRPEGREELYLLFKRILEERGENFVEITGLDQARFNNALEAITHFFKEI